MNLWQAKSWSLNSSGNCFHVLWRPSVGPNEVKEAAVDKYVQLSFWRAAIIIIATGNHTNYLRADVCHDSTTLCYWWTLAAGHFGFVNNVLNLYTHQDTCDGFRRTVRMWNPVGFLQTCGASWEDEDGEKPRFLQEVCRRSTPAGPGADGGHRHIHTCTHTSVQTPKTLVSHPAPPLSVYHPDPDTVAKGARWGRGEPASTQKEQESLGVVYIIRVSAFHFITDCINTCTEAASLWQICHAAEWTYV